VVVVDVVGVEDVTKRSLRVTGIGRLTPTGDGSPQLKTAAAALATSASGIRQRRTVIGCSAYMVALYLRCGPSAKQEPFRILAFTVAV